MKYKILHTFLAGTILMVSSAASAGIISVNFVSRSTGGGATPDMLRVESGLSSTAAAGVNGNDVWNDVENSIGNRNVLGNSGENANINWSTSSATKMWSQTGSSRRTVANEDASGDMMDGHFEGWNPGEINLSMSGLADDFSSYDVYLYVGDDEGGRVGSFAINGGLAVSFTSQLFTGTFVEATGAQLAGNYIRFAGITGDSFSIIGGGFNVSNRTGIRGIEVVQAAAVSEPLTLAMFSLSLLGLGWFKRKA